MAENHKFDGVRIVPAREYFKSVKAIDRIEKFKGTNAERKQAIQRAIRKAGTPYDLINYNCEHFANEVATGKAFSSQVETAFAALAGLLLIGYILK